MQVPEPDHTLSLIFTIAVVLSIVIQAGVFLGLYFAVTTALKKFTKIAEDLKGKAMPIVGDVQSIVHDVTPKVKTVTSHIVEISSSVRDQAKHVNSTVSEVVDKTRVQADKVDDMVSAVLGSLAHAGSTVQAGVAKPVRRVESILRTVKSGIDSFRHRKAQASAASNGGRPYGTVEEDEENVGSQTIHPPPTTSSSR